MAHLPAVAAVAYATDAGSLNHVRAQRPEGLVQPVNAGAHAALCIHLPASARRSKAAHPIAYLHSCLKPQTILLGKSPGPLEGRSKPLEDLGSWHAAHGDVGVGGYELLLQLHQLRTHAVQHARFHAVVEQDALLTDGSTQCA